MSESETHENDPRESGFDAPVDDPSGDLLDMDQQARDLARFIAENTGERPFTLGVFGGWGEGKTTLVNLIERHLREAAGPRDLTFIRFSAWPYTTTDKLWRALVLKIAAVIFKKETADEKKGSAAAHAPGSGDGAKAPAPVPTAVNAPGALNAAAGKADAGRRPRGRGGAGNGAGAPKDGGWLHAIRQFLEGDLVVLSAPPEEPDEYEEILCRLEESDYGEVSRRPGAASQLNEGAAMSAIFGGALSLMGSVSPVFAGLRGLFGPKVELSEIIRQEKEEARGKVQALPDFRQIFSDIISRRENQQEPVYIFIDDLDRVQPDVAFDIVDSIRIAMWEKDCVFILAIDEAVISDGWLMRFKSRYPEVTDIVAAQKGREYLEKIIQLRVQVQTRTPEQLQRFLAAQFPEWQAAGDLIQMVVGPNPRRLKQYCLRLNLQAAAGARTLGAGRRRRGADAAQAGSTPDTPPPGEGAGPS